MNARFISVTVATLLILLGCAVMLGWFLKSPLMIQIFPRFVGMVFNTAFLFTCIGTTILIANLYPSERTNYLLHIVGLFIVVFALISLSQDILNYSFGLDDWAVKPWLQDPNPTPGRMAPNTVIAFFITGLCIFLLPLHQKKYVALLVPILIFFILMIALLGVLIYSLKLEYIFNWYHFTRMAVHTAVGFILVSCALWTLLIQYPYFIKLYEGMEEKKILFSSGVVLVTLTLITGMASIAIITYSSFSLIQQAFKDSMLGKLNVFDDEIHSVEDHIYRLTQSNYFQQTVLRTLQKNASPTQPAFALILADHDISTKIVSLEGKTLYEQGKFIVPQLSLPINDRFNASLLWQDGFWLHFRLPIYANRVTVAELIGESALPHISKWYSDYNTLGSTGENIICKRTDKNQAQCFPSRLNRQPFMIQFAKSSTLLPMSHALDGVTGTDNTLDYRGQRVIAAYAPMATTGLGLVVKMDAQEIYQPINKLLLIIFPAGFLLIFIGLLLLRWQVIPLIKKVIRSEKAAHKSKRELQRSEQRYEIAVNSSNTGLWDWDKASSHFYSSDLFKKMLGYKPDEFPNDFEVFIDHIHPDDRARVTALFSDPSHKTLNFEYRLKNKSGNYNWFQTIGQVITDHVGRPKGLAGSLLDINERKRIEGMKNEFISLVSHELRTPLTSISGALGLVLSGEVGKFSDDAFNLLEIASNNCERLINLINDILDVEKIESGKIRLQLQPISISKIAKDAITSNQMYADKLSVRMQLRKDLPDVMVQADYDRLMQVMNNLLSNAMKFSPQNETVSIDIVRIDKKIRLSVSDKGTGIAKEFTTRIFQKFSQADSSSARIVSGTGLGLNISKSIIEAMNGVIGFYNNEDHGATFYFELPIYSAADSKDHEIVMIEESAQVDNDNPR